MAEEGSSEDKSSVAWKDGIPEAYRGSQLVQNSESPDAMWDQISNMEARLGRSVTVPNSDSGDADRLAFREKVMQADGGLTALPTDDDADAWSLFYESIGRPKEHGQYTADAPEDTKKLYHELGLSDAQAQRLAGDTKQTRQTADEATSKAATEAMSALFADWGAAKARKQFSIQKVLSRFDPDGALKPVLEAKSTQSAALLRVLGEVGDLFVEGDAHDGDGPKQFGLTPGEARERIQAIRTNKDDVWHNPMHPAHAARQKYMQDLYVKATHGRQATGGADSDLAAALSK